MTKSYFLYGNLTIDRNLISGKQYTGIGGSVYYMAMILKNLAESVSIFSSYGRDFNLESISNVNIISNDPTSQKTLIFKNIYQGSTRIQIVGNFETANLPLIDDTTIKLIKNTDIIIIAPILNNIPDAEISKIIRSAVKKTKVLMPQGYFRKTDGKSSVKFNSWTPTTDFIDSFELVIFSDKDLPDADTVALNWSIGKPIVIVTKESQGCSIYQKGLRMDIPAYKIDKISDSTGAGDIFAAAFTYEYVRAHDLKKAGYFANAAAGMSLRFFPNGLQYNKSDINEFIRSQKRKIL